MALCLDLQENVVNGALMVRLDDLSAESHPELCSVWEEDDNFEAVDQSCFL